MIHWPRKTPVGRGQLSMHYCTRMCTADFMYSKNVNVCELKKEGNWNTASTTSKHEKQAPTTVRILVKVGRQSKS